MKLSRAAGIDLGTTNSAIALVTPRGDAVELWRDEQGRRTTPSVVGWDPDAGALAVGWDAWRRRALEPAPVVSVKRKMGSGASIEIGPRSMTPPEISAAILKHLATHAERSLGARLAPPGYAMPIERAAITVPAYFDAPQIEATRRAGELAGLEVISLVQEPTAAAMYASWQAGLGDGNFLVYDLGGGTFDVSVIRVVHGEYQVVGIEGDNYLGGDDFDRRLAEHLRERLVEAGHALDLDPVGSSADRARFELLRRAATELKEGLSAQRTGYLARSAIFEDQQGRPVSIDLELSRETFEDLIEDLVEETIECCQRALEAAHRAAGIGLDSIDHVLLVGGSTRVPLVYERVAGALCGAGKSRAERPESYDPDAAVALGAALHAANVAGLELDDGKGRAIAIATPLTWRGEGRVAGTARGFEGADSIALLDAGGELMGIARPQQTGEGALSFSIEELELASGARERWDLEVCDAEGDAIASFPIEVGAPPEGERAKRAGSALSNPSVLAKPINLEVTREGRSAHQELLAAGAALPARGRFRFFTTDRFGAVVLRLFQSRFPIRTIHLNVPAETPIGTPVDLDIEVDEAMRIHAAGEVLGQSFWAQIEPPAEQERRGWDEIEAMLVAAESIERELWGYEKTTFRERTQRLAAGIRETARTDPDKLQALAGRLEAALAAYRSPEGELTPGWGLFDELLDRIRRSAWSAGHSERRLGLDAAQWRARLRDFVERGERAFAARDQGAWAEVFSEVQATWESLAQDEFRFTRGDGAAYVATLLATASGRALDLREAIEEFEYAPNPETRALQAERVAEISQRLSERVEPVLSKSGARSLPEREARIALDRAHEELEALERAFDAVPTLGLVRR